MEHTLDIDALTASQLSGIERDWRWLIDVADADPLFNSPEWVRHWWGQYRDVIGASSRVWSVRTQFPTGLALLYSRKVRYKLGFQANRVEFMGSAWRAPGVAFSEKTDVIVRPGAEEQVIKTLCDDLAADNSWDELLISHTPEKGHAAELFSELHRKHGGYLRQTSWMEGWELPLREGWEDFVKRLGKGTRARLLASRKRLAKAGRVKERILEPHELDEGWQIFSKFHEKRWGRPFSSHWRKFYGDIAAAQSERGTPVISVLEFEGDPISVMVNLRAGAREYSLAAAFLPVEVKRVSPGWLHFGLAIERACKDGIQIFDFLGGEGKNEQYKAAFKGTAYQLVSLQLVRNRPLAGVYRAWDRMNNLVGKR